MSSGEHSVRGKAGDGVPSPSDDCTTPRAAAGAARHAIEFLLSQTEDGTEKERKLGYIAGLKCLCYPSQGSGRRAGMEVCSFFCTCGSCLNVRRMTLRSYFSFTPDSTTP